MVKSLNLNFVMVVEQDVNTNTTPLYPRFVEAHRYYSIVLKSLNGTLLADSQDKMNVE